MRNVLFARFVENKKSSLLFVILNGSYRPALKEGDNT
jgi:hypothetical protein